MSTHRDGARTPHHHPSIPSPAGSIDLRGRGLPLLKSAPGPMLPGVPASSPVVDAWRRERVRVRCGVIMGIALAVCILGAGIEAAGVNGGMPAVAVTGHWTIILGGVALVAAWAVLLLNQEPARNAGRYGI